MVLSLVFVRFSMQYIFTEKELAYLDDLLPGNTPKRKKSINLHEIDDEVFEKARQKHATSFSSNLNKLDAKIIEGSNLSLIQNKPTDRVFVWHLKAFFNRLRKI